MRDFEQFNVNVDVLLQLHLVFVMRSELMLYVDSIWLVS